MALQGVQHGRNPISGKGQRGVQAGMTAQLRALAGLVLVALMLLD
jgi:hypothetical protein